MKLKETLCMPKTDFSMKANLVTREPQFQKEWLENDYYNQIKKKNEKKELFIIPDGPPYANGNLHIGHGLNKILKDMIVRSRNMSGYNAPFIMGWDTHGLPIENAMLKNKKIKTRDMNDVEFRETCKTYALKQVANQKEQMYELGLLVHPDEFYVTLDPEFEGEQIKIFAQMVEKDLIFKGLKPVYWSPSSHSALADGEIEYQDKRSAAIYVGFDLIDYKYENTQVIIWTTTPWTIPANVGISVSPRYNYSVVKTANKNYIISTELVDNVMASIEIDDYEIIDTFNGSELENIKVQHPFIDRQSFIMLGDHVTAESGTGCVHTATGHGEDDFVVGKKYGVEVLSIVDANGKITDAFPEFEGMFYEDTNKLVTEKLEATGHLLNLTMITHSYPHDWRTKKPVIYRATEQWFVTLAKEKDALLAELDKVEFKNDWNRNRLYNMVANREEWCISRQRKWGVPIPIFYAENGEPIIDVDIINHVAELFAKEGSNVWYAKEAAELLPVGYTHPDSPNNLFTKEMDIMDVWFDSGCVHTSVIEKRYGRYQADVYIEGSDQYRGWFNSSFITGTVTHGISPFKSLVSHGFVLDAKGNKMSKSLGNTITPKDIIKHNGADILRLWVSTTDYESDVRVSNDIITQVSETYRRFRNTLRFMMGNLYEFNDTLKVDFANLEEVDQFMMYRLKEINDACIKHYENYEFKNVIELINNYITNELSSFYMDFIKDIIYVTEFNDQRRLQILTVLDAHVDTFIKLLAPVLPHTMYEAYKLHYNEVVFLTDFNTLDIEVNSDIVAKYNKFLMFRDDVNKAIEVLRNEKIVGKSLEVELNVCVKDEYKEVVNNIKDLDLLLIVSKINLVEENMGSDFETANILATKYDGCECNRCKKYFETTTTKELEDTHELCDRCLEIVNSMEM